MNIVVLMAGEGRRFADQGFKTLKPLIEVDGKPIFRWTLDSLPLKSVEHQLWFAVKSEHCEKFPLVETISDNYPGSNFIFLDDQQQGNLFSAFQATSRLPLGWQEEPLLFLDADNHYDGSLFFDFTGLIEQLLDRQSDFGAVVSFKPLDDSIKWGFVLPDKDPKWPHTRFRASGFLEKDPKALKRGGLPMMGCFYFWRGRSFLKHALSVLNVPRTNEYYMTEVMEEMVEQNYPVFNYITPYVAPMGTPEDLKDFNGPYWMN